MNSHMKSCHGTSINALDNDIFDYPVDTIEKQQIPASAPARRTTKVVDTFTNFEKEKERIAAVAAESALGNQNGIVPKKSASLQHRLSLIPNESTGEQSLSHSGRNQKKGETKSVELSIPKRKIVVKDMRDMETLETFGTNLPDKRERQNGNESSSCLSKSKTSRTIAQHDTNKSLHNYKEKPMPPTRIESQILTNSQTMTKILGSYDTVSRVKSSPIQDDDEYEEQYQDDSSQNEDEFVSSGAKFDTNEDTSGFAPKRAPHSAFHEDPLNEHLDVSEYLVTCQICSRKFIENRIEKHLVICEKANSKKRKVFDVKLARVQGTELEKYALKKKDQPEEPPKPKKSNWRIKHDAFINMVISARQPKGSAPPPPADPNPDYIQCPSCDRRFNEDSGKRHIPLCKERLAKKAMERPSFGKQTVGINGKDKAEELKRRTAYKPPSPRKVKK
ncbi:Zinc finger C2HC domain-containing protein 1C [Boothiomyces sp. JEL0838]|nr:Zinc finger C2HC domain-containing protein 1C [Boothiomyces sp. JEL0838]